MNVRGWPSGLWGGQGLRRAGGAGGGAEGAGCSIQPLPSTGSVSVNRRQSKMRFHTTRFFLNLKRGGRWVEEREGRRGREGEDAGWPGASASC